MLRPTSNASRLWLALCAAAAVGLSSAAVYADAPTGVILRVEARIGTRVAEPIEINASEMTYDSGFWFWSLPMARLLTDQYGNDLAELSTADVISGDPMEFMTFSLQSLDPNEDVLLTLTSLELAFPPIGAPEGVASAGITVSDASGNGLATVTGLLPGPAAFTANYNGLAPGGTSFASFIPGVTTPGGSNSASGEYPGGGAYAPIGGPVSSMSMQYNFSLTPGDIASGTASFEIIPEPAAGLLAALLLVFTRRRG